MRAIHYFQFFNSESFHCPFLAVVKCFVPSGANFRKFLQFITIFV